MLQSLGFQRSQNVDGVRSSSKNNVSLFAGADMEQLLKNVRLPLIMAAALVVAKGKSDTFDANTIFLWVFLFFAAVEKKSENLFHSYKLS